MTVRISLSREKRAVIDRPYNVPSEDSRYLPGIFPIVMLSLAVTRKIRDLNVGL